MAIKSPSVHEVRGMVALLKSAVEAADKNGDGRIDRNELAIAIKEAGGNRRHVARIMALSQATGLDAAPTVKAMKRRLERMGATVIGADVNANHLISYSETVTMRKTHTPELGYSASIMWNAARGD